MKSTVSLIRDESGVAAFRDNQEESWITNCMRNTCQILLHNGKIEMHGTIIGTSKETDEFFGERLNKLLNDARISLI